MRDGGREGERDKEGKEEGEGKSRTNTHTAFSDFLQPSPTFFSLLRLSSAFSDLPRLSTRLVLCGIASFGRSYQDVEHRSEKAEESRRRLKKVEEG